MPDTQEITVEEEKEIQAQQSKEEYQKKKSLFARLFKRGDTEKLDQLQDALMKDDVFTRHLEQEEAEILKKLGKEEKKPGQLSTKLSTTNSPSKSTVKKFYAQEKEAKTKEEAHLHEREESLRKREKSLEEEKMLLYKQRIELQEKHNALAKERTGKNTEKRNVQLEAREHTLNDRAKALREFEETLAQRRKDLDAKEKEFRAVEKRLRDEESSLLKKIRALEENNRLLKKREDEIIRSIDAFETDKDAWKAKEKDFAKKMQFLTAKEAELSKKEASIQPRWAELQQAWQELTTAQNVFEQQKQQRMHEQEELKGIEQRLRKEEGAIVEQVKHLEHDRELLEDKEDEIIEQVDKLEADRKLLEEKEDSIVERIKRLEEMEANYETEVAELQDKEALLFAREQELQESLTAIQLFEKHKKEVKQLEDTYARLKRRVDHEFKQLELLHLKKKNIVQKILQQEEEHAQNMETPLAAEGEGVNPGQATPEKKTIQKKPTNLDIASLITVTRALVGEKNSMYALQNLEKLKKGVEKLKESHPRKREWTYEIMELENELKLASLEHA